MRLFAKLFLLLCLCAGLPLAVLSGAALWRSEALKARLLSSSAATGARAADAGEEALFAESRRLHQEAIERRAGELAAFFQRGRSLVTLQGVAARRALGAAPRPDDPPLVPVGEAGRLARGSRYAAYRLPPGGAFEAFAPGLRRLSGLGDLYPDIFDENSWLMSLYVGRPDGSMIGYPGLEKVPEGYDLRAREWYAKAVKKGRVTWSTIYFDKAGKPVITCAEPFFVDGKLAGVSAADVGLDKLLDRLFSLSDLPVRDALLVNVWGGIRIAAARDGAGFKWRAWPANQAPNVRSYGKGLLAPAFQAALKTPSGTLVSGDQLLSWARVPIRTFEGGKDWYYLARTPVSDVIGPALAARQTLEGLRAQLDQVISGQTRALSWQLLAALLLALLGALAGAWLGAGVVAAPLQRLAAAVRRVGRGDLDVRVPVEHADEVGEVSRAVNEMTAGLKEGLFVKNTFKRYVSATVVEQILKDPNALKLGGEEREMTVFFSDMSGFTALSERMEPQKLVALINEYLTAMTDSIFLQEGTLDKYEGDAVMAFWGAPVRQEDHARRACWAALDNRSRLRELCRQWTERGLPNFDIRIGINTGRMIVGNVGSPARMEYTVLGDSVNAGARLEQANKIYGTHVLVSEATRLAAGGAVEAREIDLLAPRGKKAALKVYELLGLAGQTPSRKLRAYRVYEEGLDLYRRRRWDDAEKAFRSAISELGEDKASAVLLQRVLVFRHHPPAEDWDGVLRVEAASA